MSSVTQLNFKDSSGVGKNLTPVYVDSDKVQYADLLEGNLPSRLTAEISIRRAVKQGDNTKLTLKFFQPIGSLITDPVTGITSQPFITTTTQMIVPYSSTSGERLAALGNLAGFAYKNDLVTVEPDIESLIGDLALPY
jgi:hypothetical protein